VISFGQGGPAVSGYPVFAGGSSQHFNTIVTLPGSFRKGFA
jgi:hypothetical protein